MIYKFLLRKTVFLFIFFVAQHAISAPVAYDGHYICLQGKTDLTLEVDVQGEKAYATFKFAAPQGVSGAFKMDGTYDPASRKLDLFGREWISQPKGFAMVDASGAFDEAMRHLSGNILTEGCSTFAVSRAGQDARTPPSQTATVLPGEAVPPVANGLTTSADAATVLPGEAVPPGMKKLQARVVVPHPKGKDYMPKTTHQICNFYYPDVDNKLIEIYRKKPNHKRQHREFLWMFGQCVDGWLDGHGDLTAGTINDVEDDLATYNYAYEDVQFSKGRQSGDLVLVHNGGVALFGEDTRPRLKLAAQDFVAKRQIGVQSTNRCALSVGFFGCAKTSAETVPTYFPGEPAPLDRVYPVANLTICPSPGQDEAAIKRCEWVADNRKSAEERAGTLTSEGKCEALSAHIREAKSRGGLDLASYAAPCEDIKKYNAALNDKNPRNMFIAATKYEAGGERSRAKRIYMTILERFESSPVAMQAASRLTALSDVEAVEASNAQAARASGQAAESVRQQRQQNFNQCINDRTACQTRCRKASNPSQCEYGCPQCAS